LLSAALKLLLQVYFPRNHLTVETAKNLWDIYDLIEGQFVAIQSFFTRVRLNSETKDIPDGLNLILVEVMVAILKICGIATEYAKKNRFKRGPSPLICDLIWQWLETS